MANKFDGFFSIFLFTAVFGLSVSLLNVHSMMEENQNAEEEPKSQIITLEDIQNTKEELRRKADDEPITQLLTEEDIQNTMEELRRKADAEPKSQLIDEEELKKMAESQTDPKEQQKFPTITAEEMLEEAETGDEEQLKSQIKSDDLPTTLTSNVDKNEEGTSSHNGELESKNFDVDELKAMLAKMVEEGNTEVADSTMIDVNELQERFSQIHAEGTSSNSVNRDENSNSDILKVDELQAMNAKIQEEGTSSNNVNPGGKSDRDILKGEKRCVCSNTANANANAKRKGVFALFKDKDCCILL